MLCPLSQIPPTRPAVIHSINLPEPEAVALARLGIRPGAEIKLLRRSPAGDPSAYEIRGTVLALRRRTGAKIFTSLKKRTEEVIPGTNPETREKEALRDAL